MTDNAESAQNINEGKPFIRRNYTSDVIRGLLSEGYIELHPKLWSRIPVHSHIRFMNKDDGSGKSIGELFQPGGYVRDHRMVKGSPAVQLETIIGGKKGDEGYVQFPVVFDRVAKVWKQYAPQAFIEIFMIQQSLASKREQIADLQAQNMDMQIQLATLSQRLSAMEVANK